MTNFSAYSDKDPDDVDNFGWNWAPILGSETIDTSAFTTSGDIVIGADSKTDTTTTVSLSGGSAGSYDILNRITTSGGRTLDKTFTVPVSEQ